jgi:EAL domain-containing protein (putative c-di-GMP-specific phosphodiesterase class I)
MAMRQDDFPQNEELEARRRQLAEAEENLRLIQERKSEYPLSTDIPISLIKEERKLEQHITSLRQQITETGKGTPSGCDTQPHGSATSQTTSGQQAGINYGTINQNNYYSAQPSDTSPSAEEHPTTNARRLARLMIEIEGQVEHFTEKEREAFIWNLSRLLGVPEEHIRILRVTDGSIKIELALPEDAARRMEEIYRNNDPALEQLQAKVQGVQVETYEEDLIDILKEVVAFKQAAEDFQQSLVYDPALSPILRDQLQLEAELRQAIANEELMLHYQPILDLARNEMVGVEALVRWPHPTRGMLMPGSFLPLAEEVGLIEALDHWVLQSGLQQAAAWDAAQQPLDVSLNLSAQSLQNSALVDTMQQLLHTSGAPAHRIIIEITEHAAHSDMATTQQVLAGLRDLGLRIALDDFGSSYASLSSLPHLPVDVLKVDRMLTAGVGQQPRDESVVQALLTFGRALNCSVVVEGVEELEQSNWLRQVSCPLVQGYLFGRPTSAANISLLYEQMHRREWQMGYSSSDT